MSRWLMVLWSIAAATVSSVAVAAETSSSPLDHARAATVLLEVDRVFQGHHSYLRGLGVAVGDEGIVVTCASAVSSQGTAQIMGIARSVEMRIVRITARAADAPAGREAVGTILASGGDIALVRTQPAPTTTIERVAASGGAEDGDTVWVIEVVDGAGEGKLRRRVARATVDVVAGQAVLVHDTAPGGILCGSPVLDRYGALAGLVSGGNVQGHPVIVPWKEIERFVLDERVRVRFRPPAVLSPPQPIDVTVTEVFGDLGAVAGTASLSGAGIEPIEVAMVEDEDGWNATFRISQHGSTRGMYTARIGLLNAEGEQVFVREERIAASDEAIIKLDDRESASEILRRRRAMENPVTLSEYARSMQSLPESEEQDDSRLAERLEGWIDAATGALDFYRYQEVPELTDRSVVRRFDAVRRLLKMADGEEPGPASLVQDLEQHRGALQRLHESLRRNVAALDLCLCDENHWVPCSNGTQCTTLEKFGTAP